jgi:lipid A 4'-phosphatase
MIRAGELRVRRLLWTAIGVAAAITTTLVLFPTLDVAISSLAHRPAGFVLPRFGLVLAMSWLVTILSWVAVLGALVLLIANLRTGHPVVRALDTSRLLLVLLTFFLVPGLLVNTILKHHVGRARPIETVQFGGHAQFSRAGLPADQCRRNCTFPSGEASAAFALAAVGVATGSPAVLAGALVTGTLVSIVRVLTGAHFVSDVASSALLTLLAIVLLDRLLPRRPRDAPG